MTEDEHEAFERRLRGLEDHVALYQLFSALPAVMDAGTPDQVGAFFTEDGEYVTDVAGTVPMRGRADISAIFGSQMHQQVTEQGAGHTQSLPHIHIDGDKAEVITYIVLFLLKEKEWHVSRVAANRYSCLRTADGWRIKKREVRQLGTVEGRALFHTAPLDLPWIK